MRKEELEREMRRLQIRCAEAESVRDLAVNALREVMEDVPALTAHDDPAAPWDAVRITYRAKTHHMVLNALRSAERDA